MTLEELNNSLSTFLSEGATSADIATAVNAVREGFNSVLSERDNANTLRETAESEAQKYARLNNELFLKVNIGNSNIEQDEPAGGEPPAKRCFDDIEY